MSMIQHRPARLDVLKGMGDLLVLPFRVESGGDPVDIGGWTLEAERATVEVMDGPGGRFDVAFTVGAAKGTWWVRRTEPSARTLVSGQFDATRHGVSSPDGSAEITLTLGDAGEVTLTLGEAVDAEARAAISAHVDDHPGGGTFDGVHNDLDGRDADDAHPVGSVTGLQAALDGKADDPHTHVEADVTDLGAYPDATGQPAGKVAETDGADGWAFIDTPAGEDGGAPSPHALGGEHHSADTLANLNSKVSDATLDDASDARTPTVHGNEAHDPDFEEGGTAAAAVSSHEAAGDPHGQYLTESAAEATYVAHESDHTAARPAADLVVWLTGEDPANKAEGDLRIRDAD